MTVRKKKVPKTKRPKKIEPIRAKIIRDGLQLCVQPEPGELERVGFSEGDLAMVGPHEDWLQADYERRQRQLTREMAAHYIRALYILCSDQSVANDIFDEAMRALQIRMPRGARK